MAQSQRVARPVSSEIEKTPSWEGMAYLSVVYVVWGSTYLAIRIAVRDGSGFPPFTMAAMRLTLAGVLFLLLGVLRRQRIKIDRRELLVLAGSGVMLWGIANGLVVWAEQWVNSGLAALFVAAIPIWAAVIDAAASRQRLSWRLMLALLIGLSGVGLLGVPVMENGVQANWLSLGALLLASLSWAGGVVLQGRKAVSVSPVVSSGYQQVFGGLWLIGMLALAHEPAPHPVPEAWAAWGYLVVFGGLGFTAYVQALRLLPISLATTNAYVNPVIAVFLGWLILGESVTGWTLAGAALVLLGVAGVLGERLRQGAAAH